MKNAIKLLTLMIAGVSMIFLNSCGKDEGTTITPVSIGFLSSTLSVQEDAGVQTVNVSFGAEVPVDASFTVDVTGTAVYTDDYTTDPDASSGSFTVDVAAGETSKTFSFTPVDNDDVDSDERTVIFTISGAADGVDLGSDLVFTVTINDNEIPPVTIASLRADFAANGEASLTEGYVLGVVTSEKSNITGKNVVIQDATDGMVIRFTADNEDFDLGDELSIQLNGGTLTEFNGLVQIGDLDLTAASELTAGTLPVIEAESITVTELLSGEYQSRLVTVADVAIDGADGVATFGSFQGETFVNVSGDEFGAFIRGGSLLEGEVIPVGVGTVTGVPSEFSGTVELLLRSTSDISFTEAATLGLTAADTDFGQVETTLYSETKVYTLAVSTGALLGDVTVSSTGDFEVSSDAGTTFGTSAIISLADAAAGASVSVRFYANTGSDGVKEGTISFSSFGVTSASVDVTGEETGNGAVAATGTELYFSEYAEGSSNNKYIEIYNPTANAIDLADYQLWGSNNGADWKEERKLQLEGTIAAGDVFIVAADQADPIILAEADMARAYESPVHHNGDDAHGLFKSDGAGGFDLIDVIGEPTVDPGSAWSVAGDATGTQDHTLVRKSSVNGGNTDWAASAGTTVEDSEWVVKDQNDWTDIGTHTTTADPID